ncbi:hypothetical protein HN51_018656 [Arachis hypogaea]|uniref:Protein kinase domain-containing protein n=1 Tax=Arachis hypogaea TaxID=3818 RepID=A0A445BUA3_ARAHY|nr:receptor-like protein kinase HSL1 [Arachis hypogaea]RYR42222.1 hypothetical protein Ahy_A08g038699 [Arachis hypogaea]
MNATQKMSKIPLRIRRFSLHFFFLLTLTLSSDVISQTTEQTTLLTFKRQLGDPPSLQSWQPSPSSSPCGWQEVRCTGGAVTELLLANKDITVKNLLAPTICDGLRNLTKLDLSNNSISGEFPTSLYNCSNLNYLDLSQNYLAGKIPDDVDRLRTLTYLNLGGNSFIGDVPPAIGNLPELRTLHLFQNNFNGTLAKEIGNLSNLEILGLAFNYRLAPAPIPVDFGNLTNLKFLWLSQCNLTGEIPQSFAKLENLEKLDLSMNNLTGRIPTSLFSLRNLTFLYLYHNKLFGEIPNSVQALNLAGVDLSMNNLTGSIPKDFGKLNNLTALLLYYNQLSGEVPNGLGLLPKLSNFSVFGNKLNGTLPPEFGRHSRLVGFEVDSNQLSGGLPEHLCDGGALRGVVAFSNDLSGDLPQWLGNCSSLVTVQLHNNRFSGEVPLSLWTSRSLESLMLSNNSFSGQIPRELSRSMTRLEIRDNKFSGPILLGVSSVVNLVVFKAGNNMLSGEIPRELTGISQMTTLMLDGNQLSGTLPSDIISWKSLNTLTLSRNNLSGQIPLAMSTLPSLVYLDLSENELSGEIPTQLGDLRFVFLNLSYNKLSGNIPDELNNLAYESSFLNNPNLCAYDPKVNLSNCLTKTSSHSSNSSKKFFALILGVIIIVLLAAALLALCKLTKQRGKKLSCGCKLSTWRLTSFQRHDLTEINLFSHLTDSNLIGSGGFGKVYRIASNRPGEYVAVKQIWSDKDVDHKREKEFMAEVEILGNIRHSNVVKLLCCYSSENSKLLVYEYMENHSLDKWLHGKNKKSPIGLSTPNRTHAVLSWPTRLKIAIGAAQGLCYMHHECSPSIIHRDVKSSNILLNSEFKASIADFGLATMLLKPGELHTMSALAGSFGYIPPEYAYCSKINEKVDVYSFGVVLLELVTGREPKCGEDGSSLVDWAWRQYSEGKCLADVLDEDIKETCHVEDMTTVYKLGLICTSSLPSSRPSTREILQVLRQCCHPGSSRKRVATDFDITPLLSDARYIASYKDSNATSENEESRLYSSV